MDLSGQVYLEKLSEDFQFVSYTPFNGDLPIYDDYGGDGEIKNGKLAYSIGIPTGMWTLDLEEEFGDGYDDFKSSGKVGWLGFRSLLIFPGSGVHRENITTNVINNTYSEVFELGWYVYVENDATASGKGKTFETEIYTYDGILNTYTRTMGDLNLVFKKGWNALYYKNAETCTFTGTWENPTSMVWTCTETHSLSNPSSLKWVIDESTLSELTETGILPLKSFRQVRQNHLP